MATRSARVFPPPRRRTDLLRLRSLYIGCMPAHQWRLHDHSPRTSCLCSARMRTSSCVGSTYRPPSRPTTPNPPLGRSSWSRVRGSTSTTPTAAVTSTVSTTSATLATRTRGSYRPRRSSLGSSTPTRVICTTTSCASRRPSRLRCPASSLRARSSSSTQAQRPTTSRFDSRETTRGTRTCTASMAPTTATPPRPSPSRPTRSTPSSRPPRGASSCRSPTSIDSALPRRRPRLSPSTSTPPTCRAARRRPPPTSSRRSCAAAGRS
mmetsp:Transcript_19678/g.42362  ORF Transcript_19678/g.42362 Transcript_19678/m.42362 type:complete len:265 (-) Transcript_19678:671-1465(-)